MTRGAASYCPHSGHRSSRPAASPRPWPSSTRRSSARPRRGSRPARVEREFVRLESEASAATAHARRTVDEALPVLEARVTTRPMQRLVPAGAQALWIEGRAGEADSAWGEGAAWRAERATTASCSDPRHARDRQRARTHSGRRRDPALPGVPRPRRRESGGRGAHAQPAGVAACHAGQVRARGRALGRGQRDPGPAREHGLRLAPRGARRGCWKAGRRWPRSHCARASRSSPR